MLNFFPLLISKTNSENKHEPVDTRFNKFTFILLTETNKIIEGDI